jgi:hypothetical protein
MEDGYTFRTGKKIPGMTEFYRVCYDPYRCSFNQFILLERMAQVEAMNNNWKIFKALPTQIGPLMFCKN